MNKNIATQKNSDTEIFVNEINANNIMVIVTLQVYAKSAELQNFFIFLGIYTIVIRSDKTTIIA